MLKPAVTLYSAASAAALALMILTPQSTLAAAWKMKPVEIHTRWAASVSPARVLPEYPRPQLMRNQWTTLNGLWQYAITPLESPFPSKYDGNILVPFPIESALSGVQRGLNKDQLLWYRRTFDISRPEDGARTLLHFGAVDYKATVYLNGHEIGSHTGGYQSFTIDITQTLRSGSNQLTVKVYDPTTDGPNPRGKQGVQYTPSSGIWQTVWLETVPQTYIKGITLTPDATHGDLNLEVETQGNSNGTTVEASVEDGHATVAKRSVNGLTTIHIEHSHLWSPDDPHLYGLRIQIIKNGVVTDTVRSYFGMRSIELHKDADGNQRIFLNGHYLYNLGVLDQGFWPEGLYTAPTDDALRFDIQAAKSMGFNMIRKHVKIEPERWYYYCDKLGMLVWQDMPSADTRTPQAREEFEKETSANITELHNHPSITTWVIFNEGWGAFDQEDLSRKVRLLDPSRLVDSHSGPYDQERLAQFFRHLDPETPDRSAGGNSADIQPRLQLLEQIQPEDLKASDFVDLHNYPDPQLPPKHADRALVTGEYGGIDAFMDGHVWDDLIAWRTYSTAGTDTIKGLYTSQTDKLKRIESQGLTASVYTQLVDVENEHNGLITYDRGVAKIPLPDITAINARVFSPEVTPTIPQANLTFADEDRDADSDHYAALLRRYRRGNQSGPLLRRLTLAAIRNQNLVIAREAGEKLLATAKQPYSKRTWEFIVASTFHSRYKGFSLLQEHASQVDKMLGANTAEKIIRAVIRREEIEPRIHNPSEAPDWSSIERSIDKKYHSLGLEEAYGAAMIYFLKAGNWPRFSQYYVRYFDTALTRSEYPINTISYQLLQHVSDLSTLYTAILASKYSITSGDMNWLGTRDPTAIDTYAGLLYKAGRVAEAIESEQRSFELSEGRDPEIANHLQAMKQGILTWPETQYARH